MTTHSPVAELTSHILSKYNLGGDLSLVPIVSSLSFSGSEIWKVQATGQYFCLRGWPHGTPRERILAIQNVILHAVSKTSIPLAHPIHASSGALLIDFNQRYWELTPWLSGFSLDTPSANLEQIENSCIALAHVHLAMQTFPGNRLFPVSCEGKSEGLRHRVQLLDHWMSLGISQLQNSPKSHRWAAYITQVSSVFPQFYANLRDELLLLSQKSISLQLCLRDIWRPHVLFTGNAVTGMIDYDAIRIECVAGDIARLLGSLTNDDRILWESGVEAYHSVRPLTINERALIRVYDVTSTVLSLLQWLSWLVVEQRTFRDLSAVEERLSEISARLEHLKNCLRSNQPLWLTGKSR